MDSTFAIIPTIITVVTIGASLLITGVVLFFVFRLLKGLSAANQRNQEILRTGTPAQARVLQVAHGGMSVSQGAQRSVSLQLAMEVHHPHSGPYQVNLQTLVPELAFARVQPGATLPVKIAPNNPMEIALDLPSMGYA